MSAKLSIFLLGFSLLLADGCDSQSANQRRRQESAPTANASQTATPNATPGAAADAPPPAPTSETKAESDACALISAAEVEAVQNDKVANAQGSTRADGPFASSQCFYTAENFANSVSFELNRRRPGDAKKNAIKEFWRGRFHEKRKDEEEEEEEKEGGGEPRAVAGVGDEAFWLGNDKAGALYVLKKDAFVRVSVGGPGASDVKIEKSKKLAAYALKRL
ncbi:MAG: DUF3558 family protein [Pyrinomonadaceae bacterium]